MAGKLPINQIICGDCLEVMKDWPDKVVDFICTDPPWPNCKVFDGIDPYVLFRNACPNICRITDRLFVILGICSNPNFLMPITLPFVRYCWLRYARPNYAGRLLLGNEVGFVYGSLPTARADRKVFGGECVKTNHERISQLKHPCARSLQHMLWVVNHYSNPNELILDPFNGVGTTCVAAKMLDRSYIGIDISEKYCQIARQRLEAVDTGVPVKEQNAGQGALFK